MTPKTPALTALFGWPNDPKSTKLRGRKSTPRAVNAGATAKDLGGPLTTEAYRRAHARDNTPAHRAGCCLAPDKTACSRPPCPCNLDAWTPEELNALAAQAYADAADDRIAARKRGAV